MDKISNESLLLLRNFVFYCKRVSQLSNQVQGYKRQLASLIGSVNYQSPFGCLDLDKKGVISPKNIQTFLMHHKHYFKQDSIRRYFRRYSQKKDHWSYDDMLQALLPNADFCLVSRVVRSLTGPCSHIDNKILAQSVALVISEEVSAMDQDFSIMNTITRGSLRIGAQLWRLLDKNHSNCVTFKQITYFAQYFEAELSQLSWIHFLEWHFHSGKTELNRDGFMTLLNVHNDRKRATSACRIDQFVIQTQQAKKFEQERARHQRIEKAVQDKVIMLAKTSASEFRNATKKEHFPYGLLMDPKVLRGKPGYSNPKNMVKYTVERNDKHVL